MLFRKMSAAASTFEVNLCSDTEMDDDEYLYGSEVSSAPRRQNPAESRTSPLWERREITSSYGDTDVRVPFISPCDLSIDTRNIRLRTMYSNNNASNTFVQNEAVSDISQSELLPSSSRLSSQLVANIRSIGRTLQDMDRDLRIPTRSIETCDDVITVDSSEGYVNSVKRSEADDSRWRERSTQNFSGSDAGVNRRAEAFPVRTVTVVYPDSSSTDNFYSSQPASTSVEPPTNDSRKNDASHNRQLESMTSSRMSNVQRSIVSQSSNQAQSATEAESQTKKEPPRTVWITPIPAGMESSINMNPGPMTGKKYRKRIQRAMAEQMAAAEQQLANPRHNDVAIDDVNCDQYSFAVPNANNKRTVCSGQHDISDGQSSVGGQRNFKSKSQDFPYIPSGNANVTLLPRTANDEESDRLRLESLHKQATAKIKRFEQQLEQLKRQRNVFLRMKSKNDNPCVNQRMLDNDRLHEKIAKQLEALRKTVSSMETLQRASRAANFGSRPASSIGSHPQTPKPPLPIGYTFYDAGDNWCKFCPEIFDSVTDLLHHVYEEHLNFFMNIAPDDRPWALEPVENDENQKLKKMPFKGGEFLYPCGGFFCDLCKTYAGDAVTAKRHLESVAHNASYNKYCKENLSYREEVEENVAERKQNKKKREDFRFKSAIPVEILKTCTRNVKTTSSSINASANNTMKLPGNSNQLLDSNKAGRTFPDSSAAALEAEVSLDVDTTDVVVLSDSDDQITDDDLLYKVDETEYIRMDIENFD